MTNIITFAELIARIPTARHTDAAYTLAALFVLRSQDENEPTTATVGSFLRHHLRSKAPGNVSDTLSRLSPYVERLQTGKHRLRWCLTDSGLKHIANTANINIAPDNTLSVQSLALSDLHPRIRNASEALFSGGHHSEAVGRAAKELNRLVRERVGKTKDSGATMMHQVFSDEPKNGNGPRLVVGDLHEEWQRDRQNGLRFLMVGIQVGISNVDKHGELGLTSDKETLETLGLISLMARHVDSASREDP